MSARRSASNRPGVVVSKPKSDVYTVMLAISLVAILLAILVLHLEMDTYQYQMEPPPNLRQVRLESPLEAPAFAMHTFTGEGLYG